MTHDRVASVRAYYLAHHDEIIARQRERYHQRRAEETQEQRQERLARARLNTAAWRARHAESKEPKEPKTPYSLDYLRAYRRAYYQKHRERLLEAAKAYQKS